jgi:hypothetical protein
MTATEEKPITAFQVKRIMQNCRYNDDIKCEWVQWATGDVKRTSLKSISHDEAIKIMHAQEGTQPIVDQQDNYALFDKENPKHKLILSLCRQAKWTVTNVKYGEVADLNRLDNWLKSNKSPVNKPLKKMDAKEIERIIAALGSIVKSIYK